MEPSGFDERLEAYVDGELTPAERAAFEERLAAEPACRRRLEERRRLRAAWRTRLEATVPAALERALRAMAQEARRPVESEARGERRAATARYVRRGAAAPVGPRRWSGVLGTLSAALRHRRLAPALAAAAVVLAVVIVVRWPGRARLRGASREPFANPGRVIVLRYGEGRQGGAGAQLGGVIISSPL